MHYQQFFELLLQATPAITIVILFTLVFVLTQRWFKKTRQQTIQQQPVKQFNNLYDRIHNYQYAQSPLSPRTHYQPHNNTSTDSNYHHAIKLLQRGIDTQTLIEYCNLTQSEAELLQAIYGKK